MVRPTSPTLRAILGETAVKPFLVDVGFLAHDPAAVRRLEGGEEPDRPALTDGPLRTARAVASRLEQAVGSSVRAQATSVLGGRQ